MNRLRLERVFDAPREKVSRAWIDPQPIHKWFVYRAPVDWIADPVAHVTPGGPSRFAAASDNDDTQAFKFHGAYQDVKSPERLVFTWDWEVLRDVGPGNTTVTVEFLKQSGKARLVLTQEHLPSAAARDAFEKGWADTLAESQTSCPPHPLGRGRRRFIQGLYGHYSRGTPGRDRSSSRSWINDNGTSLFDRFQRGRGNGHRQRGARTIRGHR